MVDSAKKIIVTGADGFIGSHLAEELVRKGYHVRALVWYNAFGHHGWLDRIDPRLRSEMEIISGDIRDPHAMLDLVDGADSLFHLAALIGIPYSYFAADSYVQTNVTGTLNLLQAARRAGIRRFIHTSTSEVYGSARKLPMDEEHPLSAQSPYAASKIGADQLALSFYRSHTLPVVCIRPFNCFGPRQSARAVIPTIISQLTDNRELEHNHGKIRLGSTSPKRDFSFVLDTVAGFIAALEADADAVVGEVINIGSGEDISIADTVGRIAEIVGVENFELISDHNRIRPEASEVDRLLCDNSKARKLLGWRPRTRLDDGLRQTIDWFRAGDNLLFSLHADRYAI